MRYTAILYKEYFFRAWEIYLTLLLPTTGRRANVGELSMVHLPGYKRLRAFAEEFKRDFECLQVQPKTVVTRQRQFSIYLDSRALKDNLEGSSTNVESSLTLTTTASNCDPGIVDSPQPMSELCRLLSTVEGSMNMDDII